MTRKARKSGQNSLLRTPMYATATFWPVGRCRARCDSAPPIGSQHRSSAMFSVAAVGHPPEVARARELRVFGVPLHPLTMAETVDRVEQLVGSPGAHQHVVLNAAKIVQLQDDLELRDIIANCSLVNADGQSVVWATRLLGHDVPERVAGIDLMAQVLARAAARGWPVYFLGATDSVVGRVVEIER